MDTASRTAAALGVDFGTHHTVATVLRDDGRRHQLLFDGSPLLPSGIYLDTNALVQVGRDATHQGRRRPERYERNPKLRLEASTILLGDRELPVREAVAAVLRRVITECNLVAGPPRSVTVTVPAGWGPARRHVIADAAASAGALDPQLLPEPVAAARYFTEVLGRAIGPGQAVVVFDMGAGTFDASVVARTDTGYEVLAVDGSDRVGGHYLDQTLVDYLGGRFAGTEDRAERWRALLDPDAGSETLRSRFTLYDEVREAKERLSRQSTTDVPVPGFATEELLTRSELELLARPLLAQAVEITKAVIRESGLGPDRVAGLLMVGGASRMPLAATMIHQELGIAPTMIEQPELVVSEGAVAGSAPSPPLAPPVILPPPASSSPPYVPAPTQVLPQAPRRRNRSAILLVALFAALALGSGSLVAWVIDNWTDEPETKQETTGETTGVGESPDLTPNWADASITETASTATEITIATSADPDLTGCTAAYKSVVEEGEADVDCTGFTIDGLVPETDYEITIFGPDADPDASLTTAVSTEVLTGEVYWDCPQTREYCATQGGKPGIRGVYDDRSSTVAYAEVGAVYELVCYETAETITPRGEEEDGVWDYHLGKDPSNVMVEVRLDGGSPGYIPFVWLVIDPADVNSLGGLPQC
ncbi:Hsp70 family protein [Glycomyces sp. NPDC046736]|uniref:Hsp70 family protein n=1 Tax=Glycomyces sp. NPDC046736 TaxID=3155615 RepID=UPI0033DA1F35